MWKGHCKRVEGLLPCGISEGNTLVYWACFFHFVLVECLEGLALGSPGSVPLLLFALRDRLGSYIVLPSSISV